MDPKDPKFRDSITALARLQKLTVPKLDEVARENGVAIRATNEDYRTYLGRVWTRVTGQDNFDLAYSTLALIETMKDDPTPSLRGERGMRDRIQRQVGHQLEEIKTDEQKTDLEFMKLLRQV